MAIPNRPAEGEQNLGHPRFREKIGPAAGGIDVMQMLPPRGEANPLFTRGLAGERRRQIHAARGGSRRRSFYYVADFRNGQPAYVVVNS